MEKLHELHQEGRYDLLVLDTPPSRNALDFLDAPRRLSTFIDSRSLAFFRGPGKLGLKIVGRGTGVVFSVLRRATGIDVLQDLSEFFRSFGDMADGFRERAERVNALLASDASAFVLVTSPRDAAIDEALYFHRRLVEADLPFAGAIANRVHVAGDPADPEELTALLGDDLAPKVLRAYEHDRELAEHDARNLAELRRQLRRRPLIEVPMLDGDVHDLAGLARMNEFLFRKP